MNEDPHDYDYEPVSELFRAFEHRTGRDGLALIMVSQDRENGKIHTSTALFDATDDVEDAGHKREVLAAVRRWLSDFEREECLE